jgi:hypothetical protein
MIERIHAYLLETGASSATEIAARFLKIRGGGGTAGVDDLVGRLLAGRAGFVRERDGRWSAVPLSPGGLHQTAFACISVRETRDGSQVALAAVRVRDGREEERLVTEPSGAGERHARELLAFAGDDVLVAENAPALWRWFSRWVPSEEIENVGISLGRLARAIFPDAAIRDLLDLARRLGVPAYEGDDPLLRARQTAAVLESMLERCAAAGSRDLEAVLELQAAATRPVDLTRFAFDRSFLASLPSRPGVYVMRDADGRCLYVGKAKNLRSRVQSYFFPAAGRDARIARVLERLHDLTIRAVGSELEALLEEHRLIHDERPTENTQRDAEPAVENTPPFLLVLPGAEPGTAWVLLHRGGRLRAATTSIVDPDVELVHALLAEEGAAEVESELGAGLRAIATRYFARNRDAMTYLDLRSVVDPTEGVARALNLIRGFDPSAGPLRSV